MKSALRSVGNVFLTGLLAILPLYLTFVALHALFQLVDKSAGQWVTMITGYEFPGAGVVATLLIVMFIGILVSRIGLARFGAVTEGLFNRVPGLGRIYRSLRSLLDPLADPATRPFREAVWVDLGGELRTMGFVTSPLFRESAGAAEQVSVYLPMSHPYVGYVVTLPAASLRPCPATFEEAVSYHLSCGSALPQHYRALPMLSASARK